MKPATLDRHHALFDEALAWLRRERAAGADYRPEDLDVLTAWHALIERLPRARDAARRELAAFLAEHVATLRDLAERAMRGCGPTPFLDDVERILASYA